jgi:hypothetical protein
MIFLQRGRRLVIRMPKTKFTTFKLIKSGDTPLSNTTDKYEMESKLEMLESLVPICHNVLFESERLSDVSEDSDACSL